MALIPSNPEDTREVVSAMSKDGSHFGGRFVCKNRNVVERDNARAMGDGCPCGVDESSRRGSIFTNSYV
jgi:hypothetical protein